MRRQDILDVFRGDLFLRNHTPRQVVRTGRKVRVCAIPDLRVGVQIAEHVPCARRIIHMVGVLMTAERIARIQHAVQRQVEVVFRDELLQIRRAHVLFLFTVSILEVKLVDAQLVRHDDIDIVRHTARHPMMSADGLEPPDLVYILKRNAVHLVGAVSLQQTAETLNALTGRVDVGQDEVDDVLLANAAGNLRLAVFCRLVHHQRISPQNTGIRGNSLGGRHADIGRIDARSRPDALALDGVRHGRHPHRVPWQRDLHMRQHRFVDRRMLFRLHDHELFGREMARTRIVVARDHGRAIVRSVFTN